MWKTAENWRSSDSIAMAMVEMVLVLGVALLLASSALGLGSGADQGEVGSPVEAGEEETMRKATFAAGCFWGIESAFRAVEGVTSTRVGYTGGETENPSYREVCTDLTGHAEAVEVTYDPKRVTYEDLLDLFWKIHDPTQHNRQGPDVGSQYRSAIYFHDADQEKAARASRDALEKSGRFKRDIATEIVPAAKFYEAEEYHQQYLEKRGLGSCSTR
jgi:peptide-methionine (S)-S-oxide reductase